jgi:hypothetical protein
VPGRLLPRVGWVVCVAFFATAVGPAVQLVATGGTLSWTDDVLFPLVVFAFPVVGLLIARRQPANRTGALLIAIGAAWTLGAAAALWGWLGWPGADIAAVLDSASWVPAIGLTATFLLLTFPDGSLPSPRWRALAWTSGTVVVLLWVVFLLTPGTIDSGAVTGVDNPLGIEAAAGVLQVGAVALIALLVGCILGSAVGLALRLRRSRGLPRLQLRWLASAGVLVAGLYAFALLVSVVVGGEAPVVVALQTVWSTSLVTLPVSIGIAVTRYRLYEIDRVVSRTVSYTLLSGLVAVLFVGIVLLAAQIGLGSSWGVAAATLASLAVLAPLRRWLQDRVDRRFDRARFDGARTAEEFALRLRDEVDLETLHATLLQTVGRTVAPESASVWLRRPAGHGS